MTRTKVTKRFVEAINNGKFETWTKNSALNPAEITVIADGGVRFNFETRRRVTVKGLEKDGFTRRAK